MLPKWRNVPFTVAFLFSTQCFSQNVGVSNYLWVASYGTETYADGSSPTKNAELLARKFYDYLASKISASSYPYINTSQYLLRLGTNATWSNYAADQTQMCEFVIKTGHGIPAGLCFYDRDVNINSKKLAGWTKWLVQFSCVTLMPFNDASMASYQPSIWDAFGGLHGMFGFGSIVWGSTTYQCGFLWLQKCYKTPESLWDEFLQRWVIGKQQMHSAWFNAVYNRLYKYMNYSGVVPVACGVGVLENGNIIMGYAETIDKTYLSPMPVPAAAFCTGSTYAVYGSPQY